MIYPNLVQARRYIRKMRGGAQAHLIECDGGCQYVTKFANNPQGRRILANELVCSILFDTLQINVPEPALVLIGRDFLRDNPEVGIVTRQGGSVVEPGAHFGSRYAGEVQTSPIYDFLPDSLLPEVANRDQFFGALIADKWISNADYRQAIFHRVRAPSSDIDTPTFRWVAQMIDNGLAFQGNDWTFGVSDIQGLYPRRIVYGSNPSMRDCEPWLDKLLTLERDVLNRAYLEVPPDWIRGDDLRFLRLLGRLYSRRELVPQLVATSINWVQRQRLPRAYDV